MTSRIVLVRRGTATLFLAVLPALACSQGSDSDTPNPDGAGTRSDSESIHRPPSADTIWRIEPEPALVLGLSAELEAHQFHQIRGATRLSTGVVVVLDGGSRQLRAFSPGGAHLWTAGGPGDGPGEMRGPERLERLPGDTLQVQDGLSRIRYAHDGSLVTDELLPVAELLEFGRYYAWECPVPGFVGDQVLACSGGFDAGQVPRQAGPWRVETELALLPWDLGSIDRLGVFLVEEAWALPPEEPLVLPDGITVLRGGSILGYVSPPMSRKGLFAVGGWPRKLAVADSWGDRVQVFELVAGGALPGVTMPIRHSRRPATADEMAAAWEAAAVRIVRGSPEYLREHLPPPDSVPNLDHLLVDDGGMVWVGAYRADPAAPQLYHVYDPEGRFLAQAMMPGGVEVLEIGADHVLGIARDELDVERVVVLNLVREP